MLLDDYKVIETIIQIQYPDSFHLWDRAGMISNEICKIWPSMKLIDAQPRQQVLSGNGVTIQTAIDKSTITIVGGGSIDSHKIKLISDTLDVWFEQLQIDELTRISAKVSYVKEFTDILDANQYLLSLGLVRWPKSKVFDQPENSPLNGFELLYRFEDKISFSVLRLKAEKILYEVSLDPYFVENPNISATKERVIIDFDRGSLGSINAEKFKFEDWIKGYFHVLRRDVDKILKG